MLGRRKQGFVNLESYADCNVSVAATFIFYLFIDCSQVFYTCEPDRFSARGVLRSYACHRESCDSVPMVIAESEETAIVTSYPKPTLKGKKMQQ